MFIKNIQRKCMEFGRYGFQLQRNFTTNQHRNHKFITIDQNAETSIATLTLNRPPANALNTELMVQIKDSINQLENSSCRGVILTSASARIFSAGLDLKVVYESDEKQLSELWIALQNMWQALYSTPLPTVALINGHATAGGCVLGLCCDYRIMLPNFIIGLNETKAGIAAPKFVIDSYVSVVPSRRTAEADLIEGKLYESAGALAAGLIDELAASKEEAFEKSLKFLRAHNEAYVMTGKAKSQTKTQFRAQIIEDFEKQRAEDLQSFLTCARRADVRQFLGDYLKSLKEKKKHG